MDDFAPDNLLEPDDRKGKSLGLFFQELFKVLIIGAFAVVAIRYFVFKPFVVSGASMEPNYFNKEYLVIDELTYHVGTPARGDVAVLRYHGDVNKEYFLKRVIGLPRERVRILNGRIKIFNTAQPQGFYLDESAYLAPRVLTDGDIDVTLHADQYFMLGDNRGASFDSRRIGPIKRADLVGRALLRGWPLDRAAYLLEDVYSTNSTQ